MAVHLGGLDLLVIDEIGAQKGSEYELGLLHSIIDRRYQSVLPTVVISNLNADGLKSYIGDRALDRLRQNGGQQVGFTWESKRAAA
ncbi:DNA replication protein DnaC [Pseudomonas sp. Nvir]|nr:DNA replication protein DnaC [Pseudomonas sp. Nvir]